MDDAPGEGVDRLLGIADDAQAVSPAHPGLEQPVLQRVDVLELVDHEVAVTRVDLVRDEAVLLDQPRHQQQQILEIDHAASRLPSSYAV